MLLNDDGRARVEPQNLFGATSETSFEMWREIWFILWRGTFSTSISRM
jgi:hypothetical protein